MDQALTIFFQRWGDAPVHSIAAAIFASKDQIHFFDEIGYEHAPYTHCPKEDDHWTKGRCSCNPGNNFGLSHSVLTCMNELCVCLF